MSKKNHHKEAQETEEEKPMKKSRKEEPKPTPSMRKRHHEEPQPTIGMKSRININFKKSETNKQKKVGKVVSTTDKIEQSNNKKDKTIKHEDDTDDFMTEKGDTAALTTQTKKSNTVTKRKTVTKIQVRFRLAPSLLGTPVVVTENCHQIFFQYDLIQGGPIKNNQISNYLHFKSILYLFFKLSAFRLYQPRVIGLKYEGNWTM